MVVASSTGNTAGFPRKGEGEGCNAWVPNTGDTGLMSHQEHQSISRCFPGPARNCSCWLSPSASPAEWNIPLGSKNIVPSQQAEVCHLLKDDLCPRVCKSALPKTLGSAAQRLAAGRLCLGLLFPFAQGLGGKWVPVRQEASGAEEPPFMKLFCCETKRLLPGS